MISLPKYDIGTKVLLLSELAVCEVVGYELFSELYTLKVISFKKDGKLYTYKDAEMPHLLNYRESNLAPLNSFSEALYL